jgi:hypothetical protein
MPSSYPPLFIRCRNIAFGFITFLNLLWIALLCLVAFYHWTLSSRPEKSLLTLLLCIDIITVLFLPVLILREFRPWLDAARFLFLITSHIGGAFAFTYWFPRLPCIGTTDQQGSCELFKIYILVAAWVTPALLLIYMACLGYMVYYRRSRGLDVENQPEMKEVVDVTRVDSTSTQDSAPISSHTSISLPKTVSRSTEPSRYSAWTMPESPFAGKTRFSTSASARQSRHHSSSTQPPSHSPR